MIVWHKSTTETPAHAAGRAVTRWVDPSIGGGVARSRLRQAPVGWRDRQDDQGVGVLSAASATTIATVAAAACAPTTPTLTPTPSATPTPIQIIVNSSGAGGVPWGWAILLAVLTALAGYYGPWLLRKTGKGTVAASERSNDLTIDSIANAVEARLDSRLGALELDKWRRREETMRLLRWAAEQATKGDDEQDAWRVGLATLGALGRSELLQEEDQELIDSVLQALYAEPEVEYAEGVAEGVEPDVVLDEGGE